MEPRRAQRELGSFAMVMLLIAVVAATTVTSCGGGSDGESDGELCQQCGDTDGPCLTSAQTTGDDRPEFCGATDPCTVALRCVRKIDSSQRRCFPANPASNALDTQYRCDGERPDPDGVSTFVPSPTPTVTANATPVPTSTGPTPTGATPTDTNAPTPTPKPTAAADEVDVTISIDTDDLDFTASFSVTVTYPAAKGNFLQDGSAACELDDGFNAQDDGSGTLTLSFPGNSEDAFPASATCTFQQVAGQTLVDADLAATPSPSSLTVEIDEL